MPILKICRGTGRAKGSGCGNELQYSERNGIKTYYANRGLCTTGNRCYSRWLLETEEGQELIIKSSLKAKKERQKINNSEKKDRKWELMSTAQKIQVARKIFQKWIRKRDKYEPCISCGSLYSEEWHGSHYKNANEYSELIFNEDNVNKSCLRCNKFLYGAKETYRGALIKKIGEERVLFLESVPPNIVYRYSDEELKEIINKYKC